MRLIVIVLVSIGIIAAMTACEEQSTNEQERIYARVVAQQGIRYISYREWLIGQLIARPGVGPRAAIAYADEIIDLLAAERAGVDAQHENQVEKP